MQLTSTLLSFLYAGPHFSTSSETLIIRIRNLIALFLLPPSPPDPSVSSYSDLKSSKTVSRKRWARSVSFELDGDLYAVDLEEGYRPLGSRNSSRATHRRRGEGNEEDNDEFSGMGVTSKPSASSKPTPPAALKVTYRC